MKRGISLCKRPQKKKRKDVLNLEGKRTLGVYLHYAICKDTCILYRKQSPKEIHDLLNKQFTRVGRLDIFKIKEIRNTMFSQMARSSYRTGL